MPAPPPGGLPAGWTGLDGFVANSIVSVVMRFTGVSPGAHTFKVRILRTPYSDKSLTET